MIHFPIMWLGVFLEHSGLKPPLNLPARHWMSWYPSTWSFPHLPGLWFFLGKLHVKHGLIQVCRLQWDFSELLSKILGYYLFLRSKDTQLNCIYKSWGCIFCFLIPEWCWYNDGKMYHPSRMRSLTTARWKKPKPKPCMLLLIYF